MKENYFSVDKDIDTPLTTKLHILYASIFTGLADIEVVDKGSPLDRKGIDKILVLLNGGRLSVQEKIRRDDYGDFAIEFNHSKHAKKEDFIKDFKNAWPGWIHKTAADLLIYIVPGGAYVMSCHDLKRWVNENTEKIKATKWLNPAYNPEGEYYTYSKAFNWKEFDFVAKYKF